MALLQLHRSHFGKFVLNLDFGFSNQYFYYTGEQFARKANSFKENYFRIVNSQISSTDLEKEYWRIAENAHKNVYVEYCDLNTIEYKSGFPIKENLNQIPNVSFVFYLSFLNYN